MGRRKKKTWKIRQRVSSGLGILERGDRESEAKQFFDFPRAFQ
jgi:hypothetical protein